MIQQLKKTIGILTNYLLWSFGLITLPILLLYLLASPDVHRFVSFFYRLSIPLYYYFALWAITLILIPLYYSKYTKYLILLPKILLDSFLIADYFVFKIYRFHIDLLFIKMAVSDFKGIGLSPLIIGISVLVFVIITGANYFIFRMAETFRHYFLKQVFAVVLSVFVSGQVVHIWANYYHQQFIEQYTPYFPYYFPTTSHSLMKKWTKKYPDLIPGPVETAQKQLDLNNKQDAAGMFVYPKEPLFFTGTLTTKPNILLIVLESWRADMLDQPLVMPYLTGFSKQSNVYKNHFSSGNVTVSGLFGLMFGLHPTYLSYAQADAYAHQSVLTKGLSQLGYDIKAYTSSNLDRFSLKAMIFNHIKDDHYINYMGQSADKNDRKVINHLLKDLKTGSPKPWFKFVFLTSSHHHYNYPKAFEKFTPVPKNSEGFIFDNNIDPAPFLNDYKNSLLYEDALIGEVLDSLKNSGQLQKTLVIITGDHAEEFNDNKAGYWGHGSNFTLYQTQVPLIVYDPFNSEHDQYTFRTNHIDIVPTILKDYLSCENPAYDISSGKNFKNLKTKETNQNRGFIQTSYKDKAYLIDSTVYSTGLMVKSYKIDNINKVNKKYNYQKINELRQAETHFLKR